MASSDPEIYVIKYGILRMSAAPEPHIKGTTTLTYYLDLLHEYLEPKPKIRHQIWTLYAVFHSSGVKKPKNLHNRFFLQNGSESYFRFRFLIPIRILGRNRE